MMKQKLYSDQRVEPSFNMCGVEKVTIADVHASSPRNKRGSGGTGVGRGAGEDAEKFGERKKNLGGAGLEPPAAFPASAKDEDTRTTSDPQKKGASGAPGSAGINAPADDREHAEEEGDGIDDPAGAHNIFTIVKPENSVHITCASLDCKNVVHRPNPRLYSDYERDHPKKLDHVKYDYKSGKVVGVRHFHTRADEPYRLRKFDKRLNLKSIKPHALFVNEGRAFALMADRDVDYWRLYQREFKGDLILCSRKCCEEVLLLGGRAPGAAAAAEGLPQRGTEGEQTSPAAPEEPTDRGWAFVRACQAAEEEKALDLLGKCATVTDVNFPEPCGGLTPLHLAAKNNFSEGFIAELLERRAEVNAKTDAGWTPLHYACLSRRFFGTWCPKNANFVVRCVDVEVFNF